MRTFFVCAILACSASLFGGGEVASQPAAQKAYVPEKGVGPAPKVVTGRSIERSKIGPPAGSSGICREAPLPAPVRPVGWGFKCQEFYGPTYYDPSYHNVYERLHPTYYPFYHPRLWPNYKTQGQYRPGTYCGASRSEWYWDSYDDWRRGPYEQHQ